MRPFHLNRFRRMSSPFPQTTRGSFATWGTRSVTPNYSGTSTLTNPVFPTCKNPAPASNKMVLLRSNPSGTHWLPFRPDNNVLIRSREALGVGWSRNMLYSGFIILPRSVIRRQTGFAARITRTLYALGQLDPSAVLAAGTRRFSSTGILSQLLPRQTSICAKNAWPAHISLIH